MQSSTRPLTCPPISTATVLTVVATTDGSVILGDYQVDVVRSFAIVRTLMSSHQKSTRTYVVPEKFPEHPMLKGGGCNGLLVSKMGGF
jgi:hypothetical protein